MRVFFKNLGQAELYLKTCKRALLANVERYGGHRPAAQRARNAFCQGFGYSSYEELKRVLSEPARDFKPVPSEEIFLQTFVKGFDLAFDSAAGEGDSDDDSDALIHHATALMLAEEVLDTLKREGSAGDLYTQAPGEGPEDYVECGIGLIQQTQFRAQMRHVLEFPRGLRHREAAFYYYDVTGVEAIFEKFADSRPGEVVYVDVPLPSGGKGTGLTAILNALLDVMGDQSNRRRGDDFDKALRLARCRSVLGTRMLILAGLHKLVTPSRKQPLLSDFHGLVSYLKGWVMPYKTSVVMIGEVNVIERLLKQSLWVAGRFNYLPGDVRVLPRARPLSNDVDEGDEDGEDE